MTVPVAESFRKRNHDSSIFTRPFSTESTHLRHQRAVFAVMHSDVLARGCGNVRP
jgi:hypothetical protein